MTHPAGPLPVTLLVTPLITLLLLAGCASLPPEVVKPTGEAQALWQQHRAKMSGVSAWYIKGKMAVTAGTRAAPKNDNATLTWAYQRDRQKIELYGPFGSGRVQITAEPGEAVLKDTKGKTITGANAAEVLYERLGWQVPFEQLRYWVRGIPGGGAADAVDKITVDSAGRLKTLAQGNWRVAYQDYSTVNGLSLPEKITVTAAPGSMEIYDRDGEYLGDLLRIKLILQRWRDIQIAP